MKEENINDKIEQFKNTYYRNHRKHLFLKKQQKNDCANSISQNIDLQELLQHTFVIHPTQNIITFKYPIFKTYASNENIEVVIKYFLKILTDVITNRNSFTMVIDMSTYTISAHERYKHWYTYFFNLCNDNNIQFSDKLDYLHCYNTPTVVSNLQTFFNSFIDSRAQHKISLFNKKESVGEIENILQIMT